MPPRKRKDNGDLDMEKKNKRKRDGVPSCDDESDEEAEIILPAPMLHGRLLICGATNWDLVGRRQLPKGVKNLGGPNLWAPHTVGAMKEQSVRSIISGCCAAHSVVIDTEGQAYSWGRNDKAQLGHGDTERRDIPTTIESLTGTSIITAACGRNHTLFLSEDPLFRTMFPDTEIEKIWQWSRARKIEHGQVYAVGDNKMSQLGLGHQGAPVPSPTRIQYKGPPICRVACGAEFSMIADIRGNLYSFGCPEYGQLGHNTDGKYFVTSNKMTFSCELQPRKVQVFIEKTREGHVVPVIDVEVQDIACGVNHAVMLDRKKRVFTWGFGGYGRLGHTEPKNEMVPRMVKFFEGLNRGAKMIAAGSSFTMAVNELGALYLWGKNKPSGEAAMYPKPVSDLSGWQIRSIGCCNMSIVVAADESIVSWGSFPTYGELGFGDNKPKSSTIPQEAKPFDGIFVHQVSCGFGHALFIARADSEEEQKNIDGLPEYNPNRNKLN
ncbi:hypothetical protein LSH36_491g03051 [Paralvinella palmiformis]|uniref:RCC1-like domain-containing protein n=1 Tax=Paralvinella palmiformis TaxID=53620 RepID=A0AAD9MYP3_9ANNE|nr:hypothetical protein LSH36_491g03051 [Paralvinella palmiformis]